MNKIKLFEDFSKSFPVKEVKPAAKMIEDKIGHNPGYFFFGDDEEIKKFDDLWNSDKKQEALDMMINAIDLDIEDLASLEVWMKAYESESLTEANADGSISKGEEKARKEFIKTVEKDLDDMIYQIKQTAGKIGGTFRSPGIMAEVKAVFKKKLDKLK